MPTIFILPIISCQSTLPHLLLFLHLQTSNRLIYSEQIMIIISVNANPTQTQIYPLQHTQVQTSARKILQEELATQRTLHPRILQTLLAAEQTGTSSQLAHTHRNKLITEALLNRDRDLQWRAFELVRLRDVQSHC